MLKSVIIASAVADLPPRAHGGLAIIRGGSSPFTFSPLLAYDSTYGKWVSDAFTIASGHVYGGQTGASFTQTTFTGGAGNFGSVLGYTDLYNAGLRLQVRAQVEISGGANGQAGLWSYSYADEDGAPALVNGSGTSALSLCAPGGGGLRRIVGAWGECGIPAGGDTNLLVYPVARVTSSGTVVLTEFVTLGRWQSA